MIALVCTQALAQADRQLAARNFVRVADVTSIPLSDTLAEKKKNPDKSPEKSGRELRAADAGSVAAGDGQRYWVRAEYLNLRIKGSYLPPLAQRSGATFGLSDAVLVGDTEMSPGNSGGGRITAGMWLNQGRTIGVEASYFYLGPRSFNQSFSSINESISNALPVVLRPYNTVILSKPPYLLSGNLGARGSLTASLATHLQGGELNSVYDVGERLCCRVRLLGGFRFLDLKERLTVLDRHRFNNINSLGSSDDRFYQVTDEFAARNRFFGGQGGVETEFSRGRLRVEFSGKVALGGVRQLVNINGSTFRQNAGGGQTITGGFLALETNIGRYERSRFAVLPEAKASVGYRLTGNLEAFAGYDFLYINRVARSSEQIDLNINWSFVPFLIFEQGPIPPRAGPRRPAFSFSDSPFWAQGLIVGLRAGF
jgi:hypothetical protein